MPTDSLMVTVAVLVVFAFFIVAVGYASFDELRHQPRKQRLALVKTDMEGKSRRKSVRLKV